MQQAIAAVARLMPEWQAQRVANLKRLPGGYANDNYRFDYRGEAFAVRVAPVEAGRGLAAAQRLAERRFLALETAPDVVAFDPRRGDMITRWIEGATLAEALAPAPAEAAAYLRALHAAIPAGVRRYDPLAAARADLAGISGTPPAVAAALHRAWQAQSLRGCHNDLNPWNVIRAGPAWRTLDWEMAGDNDPLFDAVSLAHGLGYDERAAAALFDGCCDAPPSPQRAREVRIAFQLREYAWARRQQSLGNRRTQVRQQAEDAAQALQRLLQGRER